MEPVIFYDKRHIAPWIRLRQGEQKIGERVSLLGPGEGLEDLSGRARDQHERHDQGRQGLGIPCS